MHPLFSVVIPTYNRANKLKKTLDSVVAQSFVDFEVLVMDDGSTDDTKAVVESFRDARIRYEWAPNSGGPAAPRNRGLMHASGMYVAFLDSDDWWNPDKLKICHKFLEKGFDVVYHELEIIGPGNRARRRRIGSWQVKSPVQIDLLLRGNALATSSVVVRRDVIGKVSAFNESRAMVACEDYNLWLQLAGVTERFLYCPDVLGYYVDEGKGISSKDMSSPTMHAIEPFIHKLSQSQRKHVEAMVSYLQLRYAYLEKDYRFVINSAIKSIVDGPVMNRAKSLFMYCSALARQ